MPVGVAEWIVVVNETNNWRRVANKMILVLLCKVCSAEKPTERGNLRTKARLKNRKFSTLQNGQPFLTPMKPFRRRDVDISATFVHKETDRQVINRRRNITDACDFYLYPHLYFTPFSLLPVWVKEIFFILNECSRELNGYPRFEARIELLRGDLIGLLRSLHSIYG